MKNSNSELARLALSARTQDDANRVQEAIVALIGNRFQRPLGDRWNNQGMLTASGASYDHKSLEVVTNMQDAVLELLAIREFGSRESTPYGTPHEAAAGLLGKCTDREIAEFASVEVDRAESGSGKKMLTLIMRDRGCGILNEDIPRSIFMIGANNKNGVDWQQGTFGLGGATTYRNAKAVVLVTRRDPTLLSKGQEDRISIAVVQWERQRTTTNAYYLVTHRWDSDVRSDWGKALPYSFAASDFPEFDPGTHLALIGYDTEGLGRRSGDEKSFDTVLNTRLYRPVLPIKYRNNITRPERAEILRGLERRFDDNPAEIGKEGNEKLPFNYKGQTFQLPVRFRLFEKPGEGGQRRNFVAHGHALLLCSNGQVHSHWTPSDFKLRTRLNKLYDRILVVVEIDALPIEIRTELFTADRAQMVQSSVAILLEKSIAAFLDDWALLRDANSALIREAISGDSNDRPTLAVAEQIARAFKAKGFSLGGAGMGTGGGRGTRPPEPTPPEELLEDPTHFEGPEMIQAQTGKVKGLYFKLNAKDGFVDRRASITVAFDHPDVGLSEISVGELRAGRLRVSIAVPESADLGEFTLKAKIGSWIKTSGGLGAEFEWTTKVVIFQELAPKPSGPKPGSGAGTSGPGEGGMVALIWRSDDDEAMEEWNPHTVGSVEMVAGSDLAAQRTEYAELRSVSAEIPTIVLNKTYSPLKTYMQARASELTEEGVEQARDRYAVGVGVALLVIDQTVREAQKEGRAIDEASLAAGRQAAARAVLSVMPAYDRLARELDG